MADFKCKMCGGTIEFEQGATVGVCDHCGTKQTLPKLDDEKRIQLFDRANHFRRENEFDKAMGIYEMILAEDKEDPEAYWGIVLCKYGIEYVEDPKNHKQIPTVNRAQYTSIFDDKDYQSAVQYADGYQRDVYEAEAKAIDIIQKNILVISYNEDPFDVFICYKEADGVGNRTEDSVYAQEIYKALTKEGYKVFFSRITLEDKLGQQYEPYIFAALHSAKVMLVVGTSKENFNAVWVKNEWSRFLALAKEDKTKTIIPCYKNISPYDMPEEFTYLQSQDMGKIGYIQDIVHGVEKLLNNQSVTKTAEIDKHKKAEEKDETSSKEEKRSKSKMKVVLPVLAVVVLLAVAGVFAFTKLLPKIRLNKANELLKAEKYDEAYKVLEELGKEDIINQNKLDRASALLESGKYDEAYALLDEIGDSETVSKSKYERAKALYDSGDYEAAEILLKDLNYEDSEEMLKVIQKSLSLKNVKEGDIITFGKYEQDNDTSNGKEDIEWLVLKRENEKILIISKMGLFATEYSEMRETYINWENSLVRKKLVDFETEAFDDNEKKIIKETELVTDESGAFAAIKTRDRVFLLKTRDVYQYMSSNQIAFQPTEYAKNQANRDTPDHVYAAWLRDRATYQKTDIMGNPISVYDCAYISGYDGSSHGSSDGGADMWCTFSVRPAMWINVGASDSKD